MKTWEDFLDNFDKGQPDVKVSWGPEIKRQPKTNAQQRHINMDKFASGTGPKPTAPKSMDPKDRARIKKLEAILNDSGATDGEKAAAKAAIGRIKSK